MIDLRMVGKKCKRLRKSLRITQTEVAKEMGYTVKSISAFENGRVNNALILLWYIEHGLEGSVNDGAKEKSNNGQVNN